MTLTNEIWFVCPRCGALTETGRADCPVCGRTLDIVPGERAITPENAGDWPRFPSVVNRYPRPKSLPSRRPAFRINSLVLLIAVIAVCLGVIHEQPVLGIIFTLVVVPALGYTVIVAVKRQTVWRPMDVLEKTVTFVVAMGSIVTIAFSALVAFALICVPVGFGLANLGVGLPGIVIALIIAGAAGIFAAAYATHFLLTRKHRKGRTVTRPRGNLPITPRRL